MRHVPVQVWRLTAAYVLVMSGTPLTVLLAGIIGTGFAPDPSLATLPVALVVVGVAASTLPTGRLMGRWGRRPVFLVYGFIAILSALLSIVALFKGSFWLFVCAAFLMGWSGAAAHQYRFAALESVPAELASKATSFVLLGGVLSAFIGPELAVRGRALLGVEYAGSYLLLIGAYSAGILLISFYREPERAEGHKVHGGRPLSQILASPTVFLAIAAAALGYGVMSFIMTATPISMHVHAGHSLDATKFVIQSHIAAMYLPALVYPWLQSRLGLRNVFWLGATVYAACLAVGIINTAFLTYWLALALLGIGWNFLFLGGTNLLPTGYRPEERYRVQSFNDFAVFSIQAAVSLCSGWLLHLWGWHGIVLACFVPLFAFTALLLRSSRKRALNGI